MTALPAAAVAVSPVRAETVATAQDANLHALRAILELPDERIDLAETILTIGRMIDPSINVAANLERLDDMTDDILARLPANPSSGDKLAALRSYLYQAGPWNDYRPFRYDLDDPFGRNIQNKLLPTYLATRMGNCVSMPFLFIVLGRKLGIDVTAATAPEHVFVKYRDETGNLHNLEATSGAGFARDAWMRQQMPMTDQALANGIYMRPLGKKETVVVMMGTLLEFYGQQGLQERRIALANLALEYHPKDVMAMLQKGNAYYRLIKRDFIDKYSNPEDIPAEERAYFAELSRNNILWFDRAEALGWREPSQAANADYLNAVNGVKNAQQGGLQ
jgi:regulator of sirC expression with transglutaminase-like and TPR domain